MTTPTRILCAALVLGLAAGTSHAQAPSPSAATAGTVTLPSGPGSVAGLGDEAEPNLFSGQVSYGVPFALPAGPGGFGPSLGLSYSGDLGNGVVGVGWTLGLSCIRRSTREGVPRFDDRDELEIAGPASGRLVQIPDGTYRVEGSGNSFRVERTGQRFTLSDSAGVRYLFGITDASRISDGAGRVAAWCLEMVIRPTGQRVDYEYEKQQGQLYLHHISWGPSDAYRAELHYDDRYDPVTSYQTGFEVVTARRLTEVRVYSRGEELSAYHLTYQDDFPLSRLASVRMTGFHGDGTLPLLQFRYADPAPSEVHQVSGLDGWALEQRGVAFLDVDGDGMDDLVRVEMGNHEWRRNLGAQFGPRTPLDGATGLDLAQVRFLDLDGDARPELVRLVDDGWRYSSLTPSGWVSRGEWPGSRGVPFSGAGVAFADINGDGRTDVVKAAAGAVMVWQNGATGFGPGRYLPAISAADPSVEPGAANVRMLDVNGDGLADAVWLTDSWMKVFLGRGDGTFVPWRRSFYPWGTGAFDLANVRLGDLNRDGLVDLVRVVAGHVLLYTGRADGGFVQIPRQVQRPEAAAADVVLALADANGNGSTDLVWSSPRGMWVLDLAGPTSAGMLSAIDNSLGKETRITYGASAQLAVDDDLAGQPWDHLLPVSVPLPVTIDVDVGDGTSVLRTRYHVRDGFWDGTERRFGGFLTSRTIVVGSGPADTAVTETRYLDGRGIYRVLRGQATHVEVRDGRGTLYSVADTRWEAHPVEDLPDVPLLRVAVQRETRTKNYEGVTTPIETLSWNIFDGQGRPIQSWNMGRLDRDGDEVASFRVYTSRDPNSWVGDLVCQQETTEADGTLISRSRTLYGDESTTAAWCDPGAGLVREQQAWLASESRYVTLSRVEALSPHWNPLRVTAAGVTRTIAYDANDEHPISESVEPEPGHVLSWTATWDEVRGLVSSVTDASGTIAHVNYDALGRVTAIAQGNHAPHLFYQYNWNGPRPITRTIAYDGPEKDLAPFTGWTETNHWRETVAVVDAAGRTLHTATRLGDDRWLVSGAVERDSRGRVVASTEPYEWTGTDVRRAKPPAGAARQTLVYDSLDRVVQQTLPTGQSKHIVHWAFGARATVDGLAPTTTEVDGLGRTIHTERPLDDGTLQSVDADYDGAGRIVAMHLQGGQVTHSFEYDTLGRMIYASDPDIGSRTLTYDDYGRLIAHENAEGQVVSYAYDGAGRLTSVSSTDATYTYHYDDARDPSGFAFTAGRLAWVEEPTGTVDLGYDAYGRQVRFRRAITDLDSGNDLVSDQTQELSPAGSTLRVDFGDEVAIDLGYDPAGRLLSIGNYYSVLQQDASGRILREKYGNGLEQSYQRNILGQATHISIGNPSDAPIYDVGVAYEPWGAIASVTDDDGVGLDHSASFTYDSAARLTGATIGSGPSAYQFTYAYDGLQNLIQRKATGPTTLSLYSGQYRYGEPGTDGTPSGPRQLTSVVDPTAGPMAAPLATFAYDAAGRQIEQGGRLMTYNAQDQLTRVTGLPDASGGNAGMVTHAYGYDGLRVYTRSVDGATQYWFSQGTTERNGVREHLIYAGSRLIARIAVVRNDGTTTGGVATGATVARGLGYALLALCVLTLFLTLLRSVTSRRWLPAGAGLALASMLSTTGCGVLFGHDSRPAWRLLEVRYYHATVSAGPSVITREDGTVYDERRYEPFGAGIDSFRQLEDGTTSTGPIDYHRDPQNLLNKKTDPDTEWSYHGARWVAPQTAQWLTPDPPVKAPDPGFMAAPWELHPYQYVSQNPILFWDPDGLKPCVDGGACHEPTWSKTEQVGRVNIGKRAEVNATFAEAEKITGDHANTWEVMFYMGYTAGPRVDSWGGAPYGVTPLVATGYERGTRYAAWIGDVVHYKGGNLVLSRSGQILRRVPRDESIESEPFPWEMVPVMAGGLLARGILRGGARLLFAEVPQGLTAEDFLLTGRVLRSEAGHLSDDIAVHGSRAAGTATAKSDIDIAIRVASDDFDNLIKQRFQFPNPGSAKERTMLHAMETGKIQSGEAGLRSVRKYLEQQLGMDVDISVIRVGGAFDKGPYIQVPH